MARTLIGNIKGPKGDTGETGATGATGAAGASASVSVGTVTALEYGNNPTVTNSGSAQNAVFNFGIPKGKPADNITELDNLPVNSSVTPSADFPVPAVGDTSKTILGKIIKWFGDMSALVATKFNAANVYNGLDKTESGYALDARQGKALNDTKLNVANVVNNLTTTASGYALDARQGKALNDKLAISGETIDSTYGTLRVIRAGNIITYQWRGNSTTPPTTGENIGTLSENFRPIDAVLFALRAGNGAGYLQVNASGAVSLSANGNAWSVGNGASVAVNQY